MATVDDVWLLREVVQDRRNAQRARTGRFASRFSGLARRTFTMGEVLTAAFPRKAACAWCNKALGLRREDGEPRFCSYDHAVEWHREHRPKQVTRKLQGGVLR